MCLSEVYDDEQMQEAIEALPEVAPGVVVLLKGLEAPVEGDECYMSPTGKGFYRAGLNKAKLAKIKAESKQEYWSGFHFLAKPIVFPEEYVPSEPPIFITCFVKKQWITAIGKNVVGVECGLVKVWTTEATTIVAEKAFFPTFPSTEARLEDFLEWQKQNEPAELQKATNSSFTS